MFFTPRYLFIGLLCLTWSTAHADTWRILFYVDSSDNLSDMAFKNITDVIRAQPTHDIEFLIQLHAYASSGLRYTVSAQALSFVQEVTLSGNSKQDLIDAAQWAFADTHADHTMLILSDHGWGILDPVWNEKAQRYEVECPQTDLDAIHTKQHRGYIFNHISGTYLTNQELCSALDSIKNGVLQGKKLDVITFDTCMGAVLEVCYQLTPYANYLVGVQSCALKDGFDYQSVVATLNNRQNDVISVLHGMIQGFDSYYSLHDTEGIYTCAAIDLSCINAVSQALDTVVIQFLKTPESRALVEQVQHEVHRFCMWPMYADPVNFCKTVEQHLSDKELITPAMRLALDHFYATVTQAVISRCDGSTTVGSAHGFAIYLPAADTIYALYMQTPFAQCSQWSKILQLLTTP